MKVYFSHGKESGPWGSKIKALAEMAEQQGYDVDSIDYYDIMDPDIRVERLIDILNEEDDGILLVGSSMGGYVSLVASERVNTQGIFLLAPALYMPGFKQQSYSTQNQNVEIVHGWSDGIIPPGHSIRFARDNDCSLHLISGDHRLNSSIVTVKQLFKQFLANSKS